MIKNLLFDLGGVIMDLRRENCVEALRKLGMPDPDALIDPYTQRGPFLALEEGAIDVATFRDEIRRMIPVDVTDRQLDDAFNAFLIGIPERRLHDLIDLRRRYRVYLLSNTNPLMWNSKIAAEFRKQGHDIGFYFDGVVTSFEAKCVKPDPRIFQKVVDDFGILPAETLFFDDSKANIDAAGRLGFKTALVAPGTEFIDLIPKP